MADPIKIPIRIQLPATPGDTIPEIPIVDPHIMSFMITYGLLDAGGMEKLETTADVAGNEVRITFPNIAAEGDRFYFEVPPTRLNLKVFNISLGMKVNRTDRWHHVRDTSDPVRFLGPLGIPIGTSNIIIIEFD